MKKLLPILALFQFTVVIALSSPSLAQEWEVRVTPKGTIKVVCLWTPSVSAFRNYAESLINLDKDNNWVPCLARDWRWIDNRTIEFKLREDVRFHNGEKFNAETVRINWEQYKRMESPRVFRFINLPDEMALEIVDERTVRFRFPEPDGLALARLLWFVQIAPAFFEEHKFDEKNYGYLPEAGPWGTGPFKMVEGSLRFGRPSDRVVLEAYDDYWDSQFPKVREVIFDNALIGDRDEAMRLCRESERAVDIVSHIRPLDTLKVAESPFAKVVKSRDELVFAGTFNMRKRGSKWTDIRLRKALNYAINRKELWKYGAKGNAYNLGGYIPDGAYGYNPDLTLYTYDTEKARSLLAEVGYPEGFEVKIITYEAWKLETQIMSKMMERIGLQVRLEVLTWPEFMRKTYLPALDKPPEEQEWDIFFTDLHDWTGHTAASHLVWSTDKSDYRWIERDPVYEKMWEDMARTVDSKAQEEKVRQLMQRLYDRVYRLFIYCPMSLYAVNKEVEFVPYKSGFLRLKETSVTDNHWSLREQD